MSDIKTYRDKRTAAAEAYRKECLNAKGEVECSECGMAVPEPRANRNAQELGREKVRKPDEGPICNACAASWRYSHHQDAEVEMANEKVSKEQKEVEDAASWIRARKWKSEHDAIQAAIDEADFSSQAAAKAAGMVARSNPKAFENAADMKNDGPKFIRKVSKYTSMYECPLCKGKKTARSSHEGFPPEPCSRCDGTGEVADRAELHENAQTDSITAEDPNLVENARNFRCQCGGHIEKVGDDDWECDECGSLWETDDWSTGGPDNPSKLKMRAVQPGDHDYKNSDPKCDRCGHPKSYHNADGQCDKCLASGDEHRFVSSRNNAAFVYVGDEVKVKDDPGLWVVMDYDGGTYTLKGNNGIKKVRAEQIQNADPATCKSCKHGMDEHNSDGDCMNCGKTCGPRQMNNAIPPDYRTRRERRLGAAEEFRNAEQEKCSRCGAAIGSQGQLGVEHGHDKYCVDCAVEKGFIDKKDIP